MPRHIAVIGAGITGVTTAYLLSQQGYQVSIIDSHRYPAMETSFANGGQLSASLADRAQGLRLDAAQRCAAVGQSHAELAQGIVDGGISLDTFRRRSPSKIKYSVEANLGVSRGEAAAAFKTAANVIYKRLMKKIALALVVAVLPTWVAAQQSSKPPTQPKKSDRSLRVTNNPCAKYGVGFAKIAGSDTCVKIGGSVGVGW